MPSSETDRLEHVAQTFRAWSRDRGVPFAAAYLAKAGGLPKIRFAAEGSSSDADFRAIMEQVKARLVTCVETRLDRETFDERLEELRSKDAPGVVLKDAMNCEHQIGHLAALEIRAISTDPPAVLTYHEFAPWFELFFTDALEPPASRDEPYLNAEWQALQRERATWTRERRTESARLLASDDRFGSCKTEAARVHLLGLVLTGGLPSDDYLMKEIAREARAIYDLEIKPSRKT